ncbi:MAG: PQQ-binding-like beta-propeller repeat protein [Planctomycetota bacterium]
MNRTTFALLIAAAFCVKTARAEWPFFRGDEDATGVAATALPRRPELLWSYTSEDSGFEATAVITGGTLYVGDYDGRFRAHQLSDGEPVWTATFEDTGFLSAAAVVDGKVYVGDENGVVRCLDAADGGLVWEYAAAGEVYGGVNVHQGAVLVATESGQLVSIDADSGEKQWEYTVDSPLRCWPLVSESRVLLAGCDSVLHAVDVRNGEETESIEIQGPTGATAALVDGDVYFGTYDGVFYRTQTSPLQKVWEYRDPPKLREIIASAACNGETVVLGGRGRTVYALDAAEGGLQWKTTTKGTMESSPVIVGDAAYYATGRGRLFGVGLKDGDERWTFEAGGSFKASPGVSEGRLVIGNTDGVLYCFGERGG